MINLYGLQDSQEIGQEILRFCLPRYIEENIIGQHYRRYEIAQCGNRCMRIVSTVEAQSF
jgi:hypothetical protein